MLLGKCSFSGFFWEVFLVVSIKVEVGSIALSPALSRACLFKGDLVAAEVSVTPSPSLSEAFLFKGDFVMAAIGSASASKPAKSVLAASRCVQNCWQQECRSN